MLLSVPYSIIVIIATESFQTMSQEPLRLRLNGSDELMLAATLQWDVRVNEQNINLGWVGKVKSSVDV